MKCYKFILQLCIIFSIVFLNLGYKVNAIGNVDWILLKDTQEGKQWLDLGSIKRIKDNEISVLTKFYEKPNELNEKGKTSLYVMRINCFNKKFKDTSINGIKNFNAKWEPSNDDELIDAVIDKSCSEELL